MSGKNICYSMLLFVLIFGSSASLALDTTLPNGLSYESRKNEKHVIHILTIDPAQYHLKLVKAHNQVFGRETVPAIALRSNGAVVMVVVEHVYKQSLGKMSLEQARNILRDKQYSKEKLETLPVSEMCSIIQKELASKSNVIGLPLPDLAKVMVDLKCVQAINLDGGGSSTLFLNGQVKNLAVGDTDEAMGQKTWRPVSNAIVVVKRD